MADEATISVSVNVNNGLLQYDRSGVSFEADLSAVKAPLPGHVEVDTDGVDVPLTGLTTPGLYLVTNLSTTYRVEVGIRDQSTGNFTPFHEVLPGETFPGRFSRNLRTEFADTGTASESTNNHLHLRSYGGTANVRLEVFEGDDDL